MLNWLCNLQREKLQDRKPVECMYDRKPDFSKVQVFRKGHKNLKKSPTWNFEFIAISLYLQMLALKLQFKVEKISKDSLDSIPSVKIQIMDGNLLEV